MEFICSVEAERLCAEKFTLSEVVRISLMMPDRFVNISFNVLPSQPISSSESMAIWPVRSPVLLARARLALRS